MPTPELKITGGFSPDVEIGFAEIIRNYGDGYDTTLRVGHSDGETRYRLVCNTLSSSLAPFIIDEENGNTPTPPAIYLWRFFVRRKQDGQAFNIKDPLFETNVLVKFSESKMSFSKFAVRLFSTGINLHQFRPLT